MKLLSYDTGAGPRAGVLVDDRILDASALLGTRETLRDREGELSLLADIVPSNLWRLTPDGETTLVNRRMADWGLPQTRINAEGCPSGLEGRHLLLRRCQLPERLDFLQRHSSAAQKASHPSDFISRGHL